MNGPISICIDYQLLDKVNIINKYPVPYTDDLFDYIHAALLFLKIDMRFNYHLLKVRAEDVP